MKLYKLFFGLSVYLYVTSVKAWTPCMPFCDLGCTGVAIIEMTATTTSKLASLIAKQAQLNSVMANGATAHTEATIEFAKTDIDNYLTIKNALTGLTASADLSNIVLSKSWSGGIDNINATFVDAQKKLYLLREMKRAHNTLGAYSQVNFTDQLSPDDLHSLAGVLGDHAERKNKFFACVVGSKEFAQKNQVATSMAMSNLLHFAKANTPVSIARETTDILSRRCLFESLGSNDSQERSLQREVVSKVSALNKATLLSYNEVITSLAGIQHTFSLANADGVGRLALISEQSQIDLVDTDRQNHISSRTNAGLLRYQVYAQQKRNTLLALLLEIANAKNMQLSLEIVSDAP